MKILKFIKKLILGSPITATEVMARESLHVSKEFEKYFDENNKAYLEGEYKDFVNKSYPEYVNKNYDYINPDNYPEKDRPVFALALSGGGIRSASFGIGVIQALNNKGLTKQGKPTIFSRLSYLSTVSGGGYTGAALSWFMKCWGEFPFGDLGSLHGSKQSDSNDKNDNKILNYIRQHGKYLTPPGLGPVSLFASVFSSAIHSLIAYTLILSVVFYFINMFVHQNYISDVLMLQNQIQPVLLDIFSKLGGVMSLTGEDVNSYDIRRINFSVLFIDLSIISIILFFITVVVYGFTSFVNRLISKKYAYRISIQKIFGWLLKLSFIFFVLSLLPLQVSLLSGHSVDPHDPVSWGASLASIGTVIISILEFKRRFDSANGNNGVVSNIIKTSFVAFFIFFIFSITYLIGENLYELSLLADQRLPLGLEVEFYIVAALAINLIVNINQISPHKMYRDRLMDTFLRDPDVDPLDSLSEKGKKANKTLLSDLAQQDNWAPYQLINCNVILNNARQSRYQGRLGDSFLLSALYCGSDATKYTNTENFSLGKLTLATAMSISGAAANPHAGVGGLGTTTSPVVSFLMTFFGFRLGYWVNNPGNWLGRIKPFMRPNYLFPGSSSLIDIGHNESATYIELSDGGHFENTGIYELVRRRVPVIFLADGSADETTNFEDFGNAIARIRIDFNVNIRFSDDDYDLSGVIPCSQAVTDEAKQQARQIYDEKYMLSERGYAIADIVYPDVDDKQGFVGKLIYIKASMTRNLPCDIYAYKSLNPQFPNQPTIDQFFDERQFESYRELGYQITKQLLLDDIAMKSIP